MSSFHVFGLGHRCNVQVVAALTLICIGLRPQDENNSSSADPSSALKLALGTTAYFEHLPDNDLDIDGEYVEESTEPTSLAEFSEPESSLDLNSQSLGETAEPTSLAEFAVETSLRPAGRSSPKHRHRHLESARHTRNGSRAWRQHRQRHMRRLGHHRHGHRLDKHRKSHNRQASTAHASVVARRGDTELSLLVKQKMLEQGTDWTLIMMALVVVAALCGLAYFFYQDRMVTNQSGSPKQEEATKQVVNGASCKSCGNSGIDFLGNPCSCEAGKQKQDNAVKEDGLAEEETY